MRILHKGLLCASGHGSTSNELMKISARNIFPGTIVEIQEWRNDEPRAARHRGNHHHVIDHQRAVDELKLVAGTKASSVIKSSEVMIAVWRDRIVATW